MKTVLFTLLTIIGFSSLYSQSYNFSTRTKTYTELTNPTSLNNGSTWDSPNYSVPIGFDFQFYDTIVNEIAFYPDGFGGELAIQRGTSNVYNIITVIGEGVVDKGLKTGVSESDISYELTGISGSQILKIQWKNAGSAYDVAINSTPTDFINMQLWLYEGSNNIEVHYGPNSFIQTPSSYYLSALYKNCENNYSVEKGVILTGSGDNPDPFYGDIIYKAFGCDDMPSDGRVYSYSLSLVDIETEVNNESFTTTPNPTSGPLFLNYNTTLNNVTVKVIDVLSKELDVFDIETKKVDLSNYKSGIYTVVLESDKGVLTRKIIKE